MVCLMGICYKQKGDNFLKVISFWVLSGIRTHDIQTHNLSSNQLNYKHHVGFVFKSNAKVGIFFIPTKFTSNFFRKRPRFFYFGRRTPCFGLEMRGQPC